MRNKQPSLFTLVRILGIWPGSDLTECRAGAWVLTLFSLPLAVISMQTQKPQRAAIPSAGRCVPFSLMQPFQWDGEELADTAGSRALHFRTEQNYNRLFLLIPDVGSKETTRSPAAPNGDIQLGVENPG